MLVEPGSGVKVKTAAGEDDGKEGVVAITEYVAVAAEACRLSSIKDVGIVNIEPGPARARAFETFRPSPSNPSAPRSYTAGP